MCIRDSLECRDHNTCFPCFRYGWLTKYLINWNIDLFFIDVKHRLLTIICNAIYAGRFSMVQSLCVVSLHVGKVYSLVSSVFFGRLTNCFRIQIFKKSNPLLLKENLFFSIPFLSLVNFFLFCTVLLITNCTVIFLYSPLRILSYQSEYSFFF